MSLAYWRDICTTHDPEIDQEHLDLINNLNALYQTVQLGQERFAIQSKLNYLFEAVLVHCETEERLMETYSYPEYREHTDQHEELLNIILNLRLKAETQEDQLSLDTIHDVAAWLNRHTWAYDQKLMQFVQQRRQNEAFLFS